MCARNIAWMRRSTGGRYDEILTINQNQKEKLKNIHHASARVIVPLGFSGFWCERCEKPAENIPEEAGTPAKCPRCHKWTVVWVPQRAVTSDEWRVASGERPVRVRPTMEMAKGLFQQMRDAVNGGDTSPRTSPQSGEGEEIAEYIR